jgi:cell division septation protein DedD
MLDSRVFQIRDKAMANLERGAWRPSDDFHGAGADDRADEDEGSRLPLLVAIALVVLAAFGGVVWLAYTQGVERGRADAPRIIAAQPAKPAPNVAASPYAGLSIYQKPSSADEDSGNAGNVPPPPAPLSAIHASNPPPALRPSAVGAQESPAKVEKTPPAPAQTAAQRSATRPPQNLAAAQPSSVQPPSPANVSAAASAVGGVLLQIGSFKSESEARQYASLFAKRHAMAAAYQSDVKKVDLGVKGIWYRLRLGGFADKQSAAAFCDRLRADGANCLIAR